MRSVVTDTNMCSVAIDGTSIPMCASLSKRQVSHCWGNVRTHVDVLDEGLSCTPACGLTLALTGTLLSNIMQVLVGVLTLDDTL